MAVICSLSIESNLFFKEFIQGLLQSQIMFERSIRKKKNIKEIPRSLGQLTCKKPNHERKTIYPILAQIQICVGVGSA